jgi:TRAP-type mannitol/chloroaromatic compound transport system permease small subunit
MLMAFGVGYEVFVRFVLNSPSSWALDVSYIMYGSLFMMGGAYTMSRDGHVRGDFLYRLWRPRTQAKVELVLYFFFFFPGILALVIAGWKYAARSWRYLEVSVNSPAGIPIFQFKTVLVAAGILLLLQGIAQVCRCILCIRTGEWLLAEEDIEETEIALARDASYQALRHGSEAVDIVQPEDRGSRGGNQR